VNTGAFAVRYATRCWEWIGNANNSDMFYYVQRSDWPNDFREILNVNAVGTYFY